MSIENTCEYAMSREVQNMCTVAKGPMHGPAPIPEEGKWVEAKQISDISAYTHGVGWCAPQQGACKLSLNVKNGIIEEALVETIGCSGMTHSAAMAAEILPGKTLLEALNTDLVCDAINTAMRELFLQIVYGRSQSAFSENGLVIGVKCTTCTTARCNGEVLNSVLVTPLLICSCNGVLESCGVSGVTCDRYSYVLKAHNCNTLGNTVRAVALNVSARTV